MNNPEGLKQYVQNVLAGMRLVSAQRAGAAGPAPARAPAPQLAEGPEIAQTALLDFETWKDESGTSMGSGTLNFYAKNGTLLDQRPYSAPLVPRSILERDLPLLKLNSAGAAAIELINGTVPTVKPCSSAIPTGSLAHFPCSKARSK